MLRYLVAFTVAILHRLPHRLALTDINIVLICCQVLFTMLPHIDIYFDTKENIMYKVTLNLHRPLALLEQKNGRYSYADIADKSGLSRQGVRRILKEESLTIDMRTLSKLLDFFKSEGMLVTLSDLFDVTDD